LNIQPEKYRQTSPPGVQQGYMVDFGLHVFRQLELSYVLQQWRRRQLHATVRATGMSQANMVTK